MSQVRKLLQGNLVPKAKQGYKFHLDSQDIYLTDEDLIEIDQQFAQLPMERRQFLANTTNAIKERNDLSGSRSGNLIDLNALTGLNEKELNSLRKQRSSYMESALPKRTYFAKQAINDALNIIYATWKKNHSSKETTAQKIDKSIINLDFNETDGKKYLSPTAEQNLNAKKRVSDLLSYLQTGDTSAYDYSAYNTDAISSWLNGLEGDDKYKAGNDYFDNLWASMSNSDYNYDPNVEDLLNLFGINYNLTAPSTTNTPYNTSSSTEVDQNTTPVAKENSTESNDTVEENSNTSALNSLLEANKPTLITPDLAKSMQLDDSYLFGIIDTDGQKYTPDQIKANRSLSELMNYVEEINNRNLPQSERYRLISEKLNLPSIENYTDWLPGTTIKGINLDDIFKSQDVSSAAISKQNLEGFDNYTVLKYFDNGKPGNNPWGFRSPYYLVIGEDGRLHVQGDKEHIQTIYGNEPVYNQKLSLIESNWKPEEISIGSNTINWSGNWGGVTIPTTQSKLTLSEIGKIVLPFNNVTQRIMRDIHDTWYAVGSDNKVRKINKDYAKKILQGFDITRNEWHKNISTAYKKGGTISKSKTKFFESKFKNVIKGQNGIDPNWKVPGWQIEEPTPTWKQGSLYPKGTEPKVGYNTTVPGVLGMNDFDPTGGVTFTDIITENKTAADLGGGPTQPISDKSKLLIPTISAIGAISNLFQSKRYADKEKQKINSGRYSLLSQPIDLMSYYNPIFERRRQEINNRRMSGLLGSPTNDWIQYNAILNQLQSQLDSQLGELTTQEGQDRFSRDQTNVGLRNQKYGFDTNVANENRKINSSFNMASYDPELSKKLRNWQTKENFRTQILNTINKDQNTIYGYKQNAFNMQQSREFDSWLRTNFPNEVAAYNKLDYNQRAQYVDLEDYIERINPNASEAIRVQKQLMQEKYLEWLYRNGTTFNYAALTGRSSPDTDAMTYRKKGGTLRGKTRYTMEPDERIWVDNNKAAHNAVSKLSENTIKLLLRALK